MVARLVIVLFVIAAIVIALSYFAYRIMKSHQEYEQEKDMKRMEHRREREERDWDALMTEIEHETGQERYQDNDRDRGR